MVSRILFSIMLARFLGADGKGIYTALFSFLGTMAGILSFGISESITYRVSQSVNKGYDFSITLISVVISLITIATVLVLKKYLLSHVFKDIPIELYNYIVIFIFFNVFNTLFSSYLKGVKNFSLYNKLSIVFQLFKLVIIFSISFLLDITIVDFIIVALIVSVVNTIIGFIVLSSKEYNGLLAKSPGVYFSLLKYGVKSHIGSLFNQVEYQLDIFILLIFLSPSAVGFYSIAISTAILIRFTTNAVSNVLFPEVSAQKNRDRAIDFQNKVLRIIFFINGISSIFIFLFSFPLIFFGYGSDFLISWYLIILLIPGFWFDSVFRLLLVWFKGVGKPQIASIFSAASVLLNLLLFIIFIPTMGLMGAGLATLIVLVTRTGSILTFYLNAEGIRLSDVLIIRKIEMDEVLSILKHYYSKHSRRMV